MSRSLEEAALNRKLNQTATVVGGVSRKAAVQERENVITQQRAANASTFSSQPLSNSTTYANPPNYNSETSYNTARSYRHYYDTQPTVWPGDIPRSYGYRGMHYNVIWDPFYRSYGWYGPNRTWVYYESVATAGAPVAAPVVVAERQSSNVAVIFMILFVSVIVIVLILVLTSYFSARAAKKEEAAQREYDRQRAPQTPAYKAPVERKSYKAPVTETKDTTTGEVKKTALGSLTKGSIIRLSDDISLKDAKSLDSAATGLTIRVDKVLHVREKSDLANITLIYGTSDYEDQAVLIKLKDIDGKRVAACYTLDVEGSRHDLIENDAAFLFSPPADENNFDPQDLRYAKQFSRDLSGDGEETFGLIHSQELHGTGTYAPKQQGVDEVLATVAEWRNTGRSSNEYLVIETGNGTSSHVEGWWGDKLDESEVEFYS